MSVDRGTRRLQMILSAMHATRLHWLAGGWSRGCGAIFMLHQVCPASGEAFEPSRILQVTPDFLDAALAMVRKAGFDLVSLDEVPARIAAGHTRRPFACFTLDDGYRDNLTHALPVFAAHDAPFAIYLPDAYADGRGDLWWLVLEAVIRKARLIQLDMAGAVRTFDVATLDGKHAAHAEIYWWLRSLDEDVARGLVRALAIAHGVDGAMMARELLMTWDEVRAMNANALVTFAGHTSGHYALAKLPAERMAGEVERNLARLASELGSRPQHFSYPYGCAQSAGRREFALLADMGIKTAVTTRKGMIFPEHVAHMTALPRFSLNGDFQDLRHLEVLLSGAPFALLNKGRRLNVA